MGVIYKIKPEVINFILEEKKANPIISCRGITSLVEQKFQLKVSKSSINSIIKKEGLSLSVGRRQRKRRRKTAISSQLPELPVTNPEPPSVPLITLQHIVQQPVTQEQNLPPVIASELAIPLPISLVEVSEVEEPQEIEYTGAILLNATDYLLGGSYYFSDAIKTRLIRQDDDLAAKTEALVCMPIFEGDKESQGSILCPSLNKKFNLELMLSYLNDLQSVSTISSDLARIMKSILREVRCIKVNLSDGGILYLDGQLHTVWSTPHIPHDFSTTLLESKGCINRYFHGNSPFIFFMAPGYDIPTREFFNFISSLDSKTKSISHLTLYDNNFEELEVISLNTARKQTYVFGVWPWQFVEQRKIKKIGEFKPMFAKLLNKEIYAAEAEIELTQPNILQTVTLKGAAIKTAPSEKARLIIVSNLAEEAGDPSQWINLYLSHWPNFEEAFNDYSRKIELFTYTGTSGRFFSTDMLDLEAQNSTDTKSVFNRYLEALDLYVKRHFLPAGYENKDFPTIKEQFYNLKVVMRKEKNQLTIVFKPPRNFQFLKDLEYSCRRLNEREITTAGKIRLWFTT